MRRQPWIWAVAAFLIVVMGGWWYVGYANSRHPAPWPMAGGDAGRRNHTSASFPKAPKTLWSYPLEAPSGIAPVVWEDGTIFLGAGPSLLAVGPDGKQRWRWNGQRDIATVALGRHGTVYAEDRDTLYAFDLQGDMLWKATLDLTNNPFPLLVGQGGVIYAAGKTYLYALTDDGKVKWRFKGETINGAPAETPDGHIAITLANEVYYISRDGDEEWHKTVGQGGTPFTVLAGEDGSVYTNTAQFSGFSKKGEPKFSNTPVSAPNYAFAVGKDRIQAGVTAFDRYGNAGAKLEVQQGRSVIFTMLDANDNVLAFASQNSKVTLSLYNKTGSQVWEMEAHLATAPAVTGDGRICYVGAEGSGRLPLSLVCIGDQ